MNELLRLLKRVPGSVLIWDDEQHLWEISAEHHSAQNGYYMVTGKTVIEVVMKFYDVYPSVYMRDEALDDE